MICPIILSGGLSAPHREFLCGEDFVETLVPTEVHSVHLHLNGSFGVGVEIRVSADLSAQVANTLAELKFNPDTADGSLEGRMNSVRLGDLAVGSLRGEIARISQTSKAVMT